MPGLSERLGSIGSAVEAPKIATGLVSPAGNLIGKLEGSLLTPRVGIAHLALPDAKNPGDFSKLEIPGPKPGNLENLVVPGVQTTGAPEDLVVPSGGSTRTKEVSQNGDLGSSGSKADAAPPVVSESAAAQSAADSGEASVAEDGAAKPTAETAASAAVDTAAGAAPAPAGDEISTLRVNIARREASEAARLAQEAAGLPSSLDNVVDVSPQQAAEAAANLQAKITQVEGSGVADVDNKAPTGSVLREDRHTDLEQKERDGTATAEAVAKTPEAAEKARADRAKFLDDKRVRGEILTIDEIKERTKLSQNPEARKKQLEQQMIDGNLTDEGAKELAGYYKPEDAKNLTPEQQKEQLKKDIDALGEELMDKFANGKEVTEADLEKLRNLQTRQLLENRGFTPDQARAAMREAMHGGRTGGERMGRSIKELQGEIQKVMTLYLRLMAIPKTVDQLRFARQEAVDEAKAKHSEAAGAMSDEQKLQKKGEEYNALMKVANYNALIVGQKYMIPVLQAQIGDMEQSLRRRLGVTGVFDYILEFAGAKVRNVVTSVYVNAAEEKDYLTGKAA